MIWAHTGRLGMLTIDADVITFEVGYAVFSFEGEEVERLARDDLLAVEVVTDQESYVETVRATYPNAYTSWTPEQEATLLRMASKGVSVATMVEKLGRQPGGIRSRLSRLGIADNRTAR